MYGPRGLLVLGVSARSNGTAEDAVEFAETAGVTFPIVEDEDDTYAAYAPPDSGMGAAPYPIDLVVNAEGNIVYLSREYDPDGLREAVEGVLE